MAYRKNQSTAKVGPNSKKSSLLFHQSITAVALAARVSETHDCERKQGRFVPPGSRRRQGAGVSTIVTTR
jgi:hypothetical protein